MEDEGLTECAFPRQQRVYLGPAPHESRQQLVAKLLQDAGICVLREDPCP